MSRAIPRAGPGARVDQIIDVLLRRELDGIPIVDARGVIIGFPTRSDLVRVLWLRGETESEALLGAWLRLVLEDDALLDGAERARRTPLFEVLPPRVLKLAEGASVLEAAELLTRARVAQVPVVAEDRRPVGLVSTLDLLEWVRQVAPFQGLDVARAARLPARGPLGVDASTPLGAVAELLVDWRLAAIPVTGARRRYEGMLDDGELLRHAADGAGSRAADLVRAGPTLPAEATLHDLLELLLRERVQQVPLLDPQARVVGVASALGLIEWCLARWE